MALLYQSSFERPWQHTLKIQQSSPLPFKLLLVEVTTTVVQDFAHSDLQYLGK